MKLNQWLKSLTQNFRRGSERRRSDAADLASDSHLARRVAHLHVGQIETLEDRALLTPQITLGNPEQQEFDGDITNVEFFVRLSEPSPDPVTAHYTTIDGTAQNGVDFMLTTGVVTFEPGQIVRTIGVPILGDSTSENHETLTLQLSNINGATVEGGAATLDGVGRILNDDDDGSASTLLAGQDSSDLTGGIVEAFQTIRGRIETVVAAAGNLPVVGDQVIEGLQPFLDDLERYESNLSDRIDGIYSGLGAGTDLLVTALRDGIFEMFGSSGLDILQDGPDPDSVSSVTDILLTFDEGQSVQFDFHLGQSTFFDLDFSIGSSIEDLLPLFDFRIDASDGIRFDLGWDLYFGFGYDTSDGFYLNADATDESGDSVPELSAGIDIYAAPPTDLAGNDLLTTESGINADVSLGLLHAHFEDGTQKRVTLTGLQSLGVSPIETSDFSNTFELNIEYEDPTNPGTLQNYTASGITHQPGVDQTITDFLRDLNVKIDAALHDLSAPQALRAELFPISVRPAFSDGEPSLQFVARTPIIKSLSIRGDQIHKWGFNGLVQHDDNRAIGLGLTPGQTSSGSGPFELVAPRAAPVDGRVIADTDLMVQYDDGPIVPVRIRASELEDVGSMDDYAAVIQTAVRSALEAEEVRDANSVVAEFTGDVRGDRRLKITSQAPITVSYSTKDRTGASILIGVDMTDRNDDGRLTVSEIRTSAPADLFSPVLEAKAEVRAHIDASMDLITGALEQALGLTDGSIGLPELAYDLKLDAGITIDGSNLGDSIEPEISLRFDNVMLDVGSVLETIVQPIANVVGEILGPVTDVLGDGVDATRGFINDPIPLVSDLVDGDVTILDLAPNGDTIGEFLGQLSAILTMGSSLTSFLEAYDGRPISFGCFEFDANSRALLPCEVTDTISELTDGQEGEGEEAPRSPQDFLQEFAAISGRTGGFSLDVIAPESILNMLVGEPFDIVSFDLPQLDTSLGLGFGFDFDVLQAHFDVGADIFLDLGIAYDSTGIERIIDAFQADATPDWTDLLDGFYIRTREGNEIRVGLSASGGGAVGPVPGFWPIDPLFDAKADISIEGGVGLDLFDPNEDGALRLGELLYVTDNFNRPENILCMFDIGVDAAFDFNASVTVLGLTLGTDDLPFPTSFDFELSAQDIFGALGFNCDDRIAPLLATPIEVDGGTALRINAGAFAADRLFGSTDDSNGANVLVSGDTTGITVEIAGLEQSFSGSFTKVIVVGADGNDVFDLSGITGVPVDVRGGKGNDIIAGGAAGDMLMGGPGNDMITGNGGNDDIQGESGDDMLFGNGGRDQISGGTGEDTIDGGDNDDTLLGGRDNDTINGGSGHDEVQGGSGDDTINGDTGNDRLFGESGDDRINGGHDNDTISGGPGRDILNGDSGADHLSGGIGEDTLDGGFDSQADVVSGDEGNDFVSGQTGDLLYGRDGSDTVAARAGAAWADGGSGLDELSFRLSGATEEDGPATAELREDRLIATTGITVFAGFESMGNIQFGNGDDTLTINGVPGNVSVLMGQGNDTVIVNSSAVHSVITVDGELDNRHLGEAGDRLVINRSAAISPLTGKVGPAEATGWQPVTGLGMGDIEFIRIAQVSVSLGAGSDRLTVHAADVDHQLRGGGGDDEIRVVPTPALETGTVVEILGEAGNDTAVIAIDDPSSINAESVSDWSVSAELLRVEDRTTGRSADNWSLQDREVRFEDTDLLDASGIHSIEFVGDGDRQDSFSVISTTNETRRIAIEGDQIEVHGGQQILNPLAFSSEEDEISIVPNFQVDGLDDANDVAVSTNGRFLFVVGGEGTLSVYQRDLATGKINLQEVRRNFRTPDQLVYAPDPNPDDQRDMDVLLIVEDLGDLEQLYGAEVDRVTGELRTNTQIAIDYEEIHGYALSPDEPGVIYVSARLSSTRDVLQRLRIAPDRSVVVESSVDVPPTTGRRAPLVSPGSGDVTGNVVYWVNDVGTDFRTYSVTNGQLALVRAQDMRGFMSEPVPEVSIVSAAFVPGKNHRIWALDEITNSLLSIAISDNGLQHIRRYDSNETLNITPGNEIAFSSSTRLYFTQSRADRSLGTIRLDMNADPTNLSNPFVLLDGEQRGLAITSNSMDSMVYSVGDTRLSLRRSLSSKNVRYDQRQVVETRVESFATHAAAGPDGDVYVIGEDHNALVQLRRNTPNGGFEQVTSFTDGFGPVQGLSRPSSVTVSSDGLQVFVTSPSTDTIGVFVKDSPTGSLRFASSVEYAGAKKVVFQFGSFARRLYAIGSVPDSFATWNVASDGTLSGGTVNGVELNGRVPSDIAVRQRFDHSGFVVAVGVLQDGSLPGFVAIRDGGNGIAIPNIPRPELLVTAGSPLPDQQSFDDTLYAADGRRIHIIHGFDGGSPRRLITTIDEIAGISEIDDMVITPDNRFLAVLSSADNTIVLFRRTDTGSGLEFVQRFTDSADFHGLEMPTSLDVLRGTTALGRPTWQFLTTSLGDSLNPGGLATFTADLQGQPAQANATSTDGVPLSRNAATMESTITFDRFAGNVGDVDVSLDLSNPTSGDVRAILVSPSGTEVELFSDLNADNLLHTTFDDQSLEPISRQSAPFTGRFRPTGSLADFNGEDPNGIWRLRIVDDSQGSGFTGVLNDWSLNIVSDISSRDTPVDVPSGINTADSVIDFSGADSRIEDVTVTVSVRGMTPGIGGLLLVSPTGTSVTLTATPDFAVDADYIRATFDDSAGQPVPMSDGTFTGSIRPRRLLGQLRGETANGRWTLRAVSGLSEDVVIDSWSLNVRFSDTDSYFVKHSGFDSVTVTSGDSSTGTGNADRVSIVSPQVPNLFVTTLGGQDSVTIIDQGDAHTTIDLGNDNDSFSLLMPSSTGTLSVDSGSGNDTIDAYTIGSGITHLNGGSGDDVYRVDLNRIAAGADVTVNGDNESAGDVLRYVTGGAATTPASPAFPGDNVVRMLSISSHGTLKYREIESGEVPAVATVQITAGAIDEGNGAGISASGTGTGTYSWDLDGDGVFGDRSGPGLILSWDELVAFGINDGPAEYPVSVRLEDNGQFAFDTAVLSVNDVAPTFTIDGASLVNEGDVYQLTLSSADPGDDRVTEWLVDWGDGSDFEIFNAASVTATHVYADKDVNAPSTDFQIVITATDEDRAIDPETKTVTVTDLPDLLREFNVTTPTLQEAQSLTVDLIANGPPGSERPARWLINWGDGTDVMVLPGTATNATHLYADDGRFEVSVVAQEFTGIAASEAFGQTHVVADSADGAVDVQVADLDLDGDLDVLTASVFSHTIAWHENDGNANFTSHDINTAAINARGVFAADLDGDGDADVVSASETDNTVAWYENDGDGNFGVAVVLTNSAAGAFSVFAADLDNDGDIDVLSASSNDNTIAWYENDGGVNPAFTARTISNSAITPRSVIATDLDLDGDMDVLIAAQGEDTIAWYENDGQQSFTAHAISTTVDGAWNVSTADVDRDGDVDVLSAAFEGDQIFWHENDGSQNFTHHVISDNALGAVRVLAVDLDGDTDVDVISASNDDHLVSWYENNGSQEFTRRTVADAELPVEDVAAVDLDRDGDIDLVSAVPHGGQVLWHENVIGSGDLLSAAPAAGQQTVDGAIVVNVANIDPLVTVVVPDERIDEGQTTALNLSHADVGDDSLIDWTIDWGDGTVQTVAGNVTTVPHTYTDDGTFTVQVVARDEDGTYNVLDDGQIVVDDVLPTLEISLEDGNTVNEGEKVRLLLDAADPGRDIISRWIVDWGDGVVETVSRPDGRAASQLHTYAGGDQSHVIRVTAIDINDTPGNLDDDLQITSDDQSSSITVQVLDVAASPSIVVDRGSRSFTRDTTGSETIFEGNEFSVLLSANDPGLDRIDEWQIDWDGDGSVDQVEAVKTDHELSVRIEDSLVTLFADGETRIFYDFAEPLHTGDAGQPSRFGFGGDGGRTTFDDLSLRWLDDATEVLIAEDFDDGVAGGFAADAGTWQVVDQQYRAETPAIGPATSTLAAIGSLPIFVPVEFDLTRVTLPGEVVTSYDIDWGDGTSDQITRPAGETSFRANDLNVRHVYRDAAASHDVTVTLNGPSTRTVLINALNAQRGTSLTDADSEITYDYDLPAVVHSVTLDLPPAETAWLIDWGDGQTQTVRNTEARDVQHVYAANGLHSVTVHRQPDNGDPAILHHAENILVGTRGLLLDITTTVDFTGAADGEQPLAFVVFDYEDSTHFKYAGVRDDGTQLTWVIGHHDETGFHHHAMRTDQVVTRISPAASINTFDDGNLQQHVFRGPFADVSANSSVDSSIVVRENQDQTAGSAIAPVLDGVVREANVVIDLQHEDLSTLQIDLIGPEDTEVRLANIGDLAGSNLSGLRFDDSATDAIAEGAAPYRGLYAPAGNLSDLNGLDSVGTWLLRITDAGGAVAGTLTSWKLQLTTQDAASTEAASTFDVVATAVGQAGNFAAEPLTVTVLNDSPTIDVSGPAEADLHETVTLNLGAITDPGIDNVTRYEINWGDSDTSENVTADTLTISHQYAIGGWYVVSVALVDEDGTHVAAGHHSIDVFSPAIGINFIGGGDGHAGGDIHSSEVAGFFPQRNWNNVADNGVSGTGAETGSASNLVDSNGDATNTSLEWIADQTGTLGGAVTVAGANASLYRGYLGPDISGFGTTLEFRNIPWPRYDIYIYSDAPDATEVRVRAADAVPTRPETQFRNSSNWPLNSAGRHFTQGASTNFVRLKNIYGPNLVVDVTSPGSVVSGIQIVAGLPELIVNSTADVDDGDPWNGVMTLREAVFLANDNPGANEIRFDATTFSSPQTIDLNNGELDLTDSVTIIGPGTELLTIDAQHQSRIFNIDGATGDVALNSVSLTNGQTAIDNPDGENTYSGGAIRFQPAADAILTLTDTVISNSRTLGANTDGGAIFSTGQISIEQSTLTGNMAARDGGAIANLTGLTSVSTSTLSSNTAGRSGGAINVRDLMVTISGSTLSGNHADHSGGALFSGSVILANSTVAGNSASRFGGAVATLPNGQLEANNTTIAQNTANLGGGGIAFPQTTDVILHNSIVIGNLVGSTPDDIEATRVIDNSSSFNLFGDPVTSGGLIHGTNGNIVGQDDGADGRELLDVSTVIAPLADNGGPTQTHALVPGSPAIDAGDNALAVDASGSALTSDQRLAPFSRIVDGGSGSATVDIGAFELQTLPASFFVVTTAADELDFTNSDVSLREAIVAANGNSGADTITFAEAINGEPILLAADLGQLEISDAVTITGNGAANTVVDAGQQGFRVFDITSTARDVTFDGVTIQGGQTAGNGGGIRNLSSGTLAVTNSTLSGNTANGGGGLYNSIGTATLTNSTLSGNTANSRGGGLFNNDNGTATLTNSTLSGNTADAHGGGISNTNAATLTVNNSTLSGNTAGRFGGGIDNSNAATLTVNNSTLSGNTADGGGGGGLSNSFGTATLTNSTLSGNTADGGGGGLENFFGTATLVNSIVAGNTLTDNAPNDMVNVGIGTVTGEHNLIGDPVTSGGLVHGTNGNIVGQDDGAGGRKLLDLSTVIAPLADNGGPTQTHALRPGSPAIDAGSAYVATVARDAPTAWWRLDETSGTTAANFVAGATAGAYNGSGNLGESAHVGDGTAFGLNGTDSEIAVSSVAVAADITIEAWARSDGATWNNHGWIASARQANGFILHPVKGERRWEAYIAADSGQMFLIGRHTPTDIQQWHHYALAYDDASKIARMYFDGVEVGSRDLTSESGWSRSTSTVDLLIGRDNSFGDPNRFGDGAVDEVAIYDRALTADALLRHVNINAGTDQRGFLRILDGDNNGIATVDIGAFEFEPTLLSVHITEASISEDGGTAMATVSRTGDISAELIVALASDDTSEATVPATVTIAAGKTTSEAFGINAVDDLIVDGTQTVTITASAGGHADGSDSLDVTDDSAAPDLTATAFNAVSDHVLLGQTDVTFAVANTGPGRAFAFDTHIVWSPNDTPGDADDIVVPGSLVQFAAGLAAGASDSRTISLQLDTTDLYAHSTAADVAGQRAGTVSMDVSHLFLIVDVSDTVAESDEANNFGRGQGLDSDDITYFPWDTDGNSVVTPLEALQTIAAINSADTVHDFDGNGIVTPLEALATLQRIGYTRNDPVVEIFAFAPAELQSNSSGVRNAATTAASTGSPANPLFVIDEEDDDDDLFDTSAEVVETPAMSSDDSTLPPDEVFAESVDWLSVV